MRASASPAALARPPALRRASRRSLLATPRAALQPDSAPARLAAAARHALLGGVAAALIAGAGARAAVSQTALMGRADEAFLLHAGPACARLEGVNNPQLLPSAPNVPVIDVAGFLSKGQARTHASVTRSLAGWLARRVSPARPAVRQIERLTAIVKSLEADTGIKLRVLSQAYPNTPGLAVRDYWGVDADTAVFVADPGTGNILNFNVGENVDFKVPRTFWTRLAGKYGTKFYWCAARGARDPT
jgi:hypothetical protein